MIRPEKLPTGLFIVVLCGSAAAQTNSGLRAADESAIRALTGDYAQTLSECDAEGFADLFVPGIGFFASGFRGRMEGRAELIELVESERHCVAAPGSAESQRQGGSSVPEVDIQFFGAGASGVANLGAAEYQDTYFQTDAGWRFGSRTVILAAEKDLGIDADGLAAIQDLAGREAGSFYETMEDGRQRLLTSGVRVSVENGQINGRVFLDGGGYRDEVYEQVAAGDWRVVSSVAND